MTEKALIAVFKSEKKADTYIYLRRGFSWDELPVELRDVFGKPRHVMDLMLAADKKLARTTGEDVLKAVAEKDYYLQMPAEHTMAIVEFGQKLKSQS